MQSKSGSYTFACWCTRALAFQCRSMRFLAVFLSYDRLIRKRPSDIVYKYQCAQTYRAIFRYSFAKIAKRHLRSRKRILIKKLDKITQIRSVRLCARCYCMLLRLKRVDSLLTSRENSQKLFMYYFSHTVMELIK